MGGWGWASPRTVYRVRDQGFAGPLPSVLAFRTGEVTSWCTMGGARSLHGDTLSANAQLVRRESPATQIGPRWHLDVAGRSPHASYVADVAHHHTL